MRDKHYNPKPIRLSEEIWQKFKKEKLKSGLSWNLFIKKLLEKVS